MAAGVGIDLGSQTTRVVKLAHSHGGVRWVGGVTAPAGAEDLPARLRDASIHPRAGVAGLSGKDTIIRYSRVPPVPAWKLKMLVGYEATQGGELDVAFDYRLLNLPARIGATELTVLTAVAKNEALTARLESLAGQGFRGVDFAPDALALYEVFSRCPESDEALDEFCLVLDVGATKTEMIIVYNGGLIFARSLTIGGDDFTRRLAEALSVEEKRAERLKVKHGEVADEAGIGSRPSAERPMLNALLDAAGEFFGAVRASVMFARAQTKLVDLKIGRVYLSGAGAALKGLPEFLAARLEARVTTFHAPEEWGVPGERGRPGEWMIGTGLALMALAGPEGRLSILPPRARRRRDFRRRDVFSYAACAVFAVVFIAGLVAHLHNWSVARAALTQRKELGEQARKRQAGIDVVLRTNDLQREHLRLLGSSVAVGARLTEFIEQIKAKQPGPVSLSKIVFRPGDANKGDARAHITLIGTVGESDKASRDVLNEFRERLKEVPGFDPPDPETYNLIERAPDPAKGRPLEFQVRVPLRIEAAAPAEAAKEAKP